MAFKISSFQSILALKIISSFQSILKLSESLSNILSLILSPYSEKNLKIKKDINFRFLCKFIHVEKLYMFINFWDFLSLWQWLLHLILAKTPVTMTFDHALAFLWVEYIIFINMNILLYSIIWRIIVVMYTRFEKK